MTRIFKLSGLERPCFPNATACSVAQAASRTCQCTNP